MTTYQYSVVIENGYLGKYRRVTGRSRREVEIKATEQLQRWADQETRARIREATTNAKNVAVEATERAQGLIEEYRSILNTTLDIDDRIDWNGMMDTRNFRVPHPNPHTSNKKLNVPVRRPFVEWFSKKAKLRREEAERAAAGDYYRAVQHWQQERQRFYASRDEYNRSIDSFRRLYESGDPDAVEKYVSLVLSSSSLPEGLERECVVKYFPAERAILVQAQVPSLSNIPSVAEYRFISSRSKIEEKHLRPKERAELYDTSMLQLALRTLHEVFEGDYGKHCDLVVLNGVVEDVDPATGKDFSACIFSVQASRDKFLEIDLRRVDVAACFRELKGLSGTRISNMQPVRPIRVLDTTDARFIEADDVITELESNQNLMTIPWQDFEVLVRDLFERMFSTRGAEVKVTRTSRDEGVDAVVFDPDPLMGGKIVIQAKRYRKTVPVAAVRELYGTMLNEGAGKGLLVTTSHFGASSREFVKDKPITLVDGPQLLHLMQNSGHHVRIDLSVE